MLTMHLLWKVQLLALACVVLLACDVTLLAGEKVHVGERWSADQRVSIDQIEHESWDRLLQKYVDERGYVDYRGWKTSSADRAALQRYLADLSRAFPDLTASHESQLAFWINAYNALTIEGVLQKYPLKSIREYTPKLWGYHIWHDLLLMVGDQEISLDTIEHKILQRMGEPRIHFAIVCASVGCPRLLNRAYVAERIDEQLTVNARHFFADPQKFRYDATRRRFAVSPILDWFQADFGSDKVELLHTIAPLLPDKRAQQLAYSGQISIGYLDYDWKLNDQSSLP